MSFVERTIARQRKKGQNIDPATTAEIETISADEVTIQPSKLSEVQAAAMARNPTPTVDDSQIGQLLLSAGVLKDEDIRQVVQAQKSEPLRFGDTAIKLGLVTPDDIQRAMARQFEFPYLKVGDSGFSKYLYAAYEPMNPATEALRGLRSQLMLRWFKDESKTLAVLGARAGAGASSLAANLAISFAQLGERTLLVDANLRNPRQHELFGLEKSPLGLSNVLAGRCSLKDVLFKVLPFENFSLLCAGAPPPNPQELLGRINFSYVMETVPAVFDIVIIDTAPVLEFADAQLVASRTGGCLLVSRRHQTRVADIEKTKEQLAPCGTTLLGAVMCE